MRRRLIIAIAFAAAVAASGLALAVVSAGDAKAKAKTRTIYMSAVERKGSASVSKEPYPTQVLPSGGGYERFAPGSEEVDGDSGKWAVETYRFDTGVVAACKGERVVLKIFGVNAKEHQITIPDFNRNFTVRRGMLTTTSFVANSTGIFPIICITHQPSHRADLVVLPC